MAIYDNLLYFIAFSVGPPPSPPKFYDFMANGRPKLSSNKAQNFQGTFT